MHITTLFLICTFFMVICFGSIMAMDSALSMPSPTTQTDTFGSGVSATTNGTAGVIVQTNAYESRAQSLGAVMVAILIIILIVLTFMVIYRNRSPNHGKYRT